MPSDELLHGELVVLDAIVREDLQRIADWFSDEETLRLTWHSAMMPITVDDETERFEQARKSKRYDFAIRTLDSRTLIGVCQLTHFDHRSQSAMFGITVGDQNYWGKGFGTDATRRILDHAFLELNLHRVELGVWSYNQRAVKSYEKVGFRHEVTQRQAIVRDGQYHDIHIMGILRDEWLK